MGAAAEYAMSARPRHYPGGANVGGVRVAPAIVPKISPRCGIWVQVSSKTLLALRQLF